MPELPPELMQEFDDFGDPLPLSEPGPSEEEA